MTLVPLFKRYMLRKSLHEVNEKVYMRMIKIMELYKTRQQRERLLQKLQVTHFFEFAISKLVVRERVPLSVLRV